jgi:glycosyltransferase involved in cell wall biosynthesis
LEHSRRKIAVVANTAWNLVNFRMGLMKAFRDGGYDVIAIAPLDDFAEQIEAEGIQFVALKRLDRKGTNPVRDLQLTHELYRIYKKEGVEIAFHYTIKPNIYGTFAASLAGIKTVCTVTGLGYSFLSDNWISRLAKNLYKRAFKRAELVAFQNEDDRNLFISSKLLDAEKTMLIRGSGIKCDYFIPLEKTEVSDKFVFLFVGRLLLDKGIREFLAAAEKIKSVYPKTEFWIVGALDTDNPSCINSAYIAEAQHKETVRYFGPSNQVRDFIRNADCVVLPSYREGLPRVMLEAISMEKPVITTDAPGCRDTVIDGLNGFMIPVKDEGALSDAMLRMFESDTQTRKNMGKAGRELALKEFDEKRIIEKYLQLTEEIFTKIV